MAFVMDAETAKIVNAGRHAWRELKKKDTWPYWVAVGRAIQAGKAAMMSYLRIEPAKKASGRQWSQQFGDWLKDNGFAEIDKGVRSRLEDCMDNLPAIEAWRETLGARRADFNHPNTVWRQWSGLAGVKKTSEPKPPKAAPKNEPELAREVQELADEVRTLLGPDDLHFDLSTPELIIEAAGNFITMYESFGDKAITAFARELQKLIADRKRETGRKKAAPTAVRHAKEVVEEVS